MADTDKESTLAPSERARVPSKPSESDGRIDRIVQETRKLGDDLMEWVNLRLRLVQLDIQDLIDQELDFVFSGVIVILMVMIALLMASFGLAFVLGEWLGEAWYGFAIMTVVYLVGGLLVSRIRPRLAAGFRANWMKEKREGNSSSAEKDQ